MENIIEILPGQIAKMSNHLLVLPYLKERNQVLMKYTEIPAFNQVLPHIEKWIVAAKTILTNECNKENVLEAVKTTFGITTEVEPEIIGPIFIDGDCTAQCYICVLPLLEHEYSIEAVAEKKPIALNCSELSNYIIYDLPSKYCLDIFKKEYSLY